MEETIYKILTRDEWEQAEAEGVYAGSAVDRRDGFIHFSTARQVRETAARHFAGQADLLLVTVNLVRSPCAALRWEPSRGGDLFPHLYAPLDLAAVSRIEPLPLEGAAHRFPGTVAGC